MNNLPFLPGSSYRNISKPNHHRSQTLGLKNGYVQAKVTNLNTNGRGYELMDNKLNELPDLLNYDPQLIYGQARPAAPKPFLPDFVHLDKKVLRFYGWFREVVPESAIERHRVRKVTVCYYLVDDTISIVEPTVENSGLNQGTLVRRQKIPKNDEGATYNWKELNLGVNINCYGRVYRLFDCDKWTKDYLESEGIELNHREHCPEDEFQLRKEMERQLHHTKSPTESTPQDKLKRFLELDKKVLRFYCVWKSDEASRQEPRHFVLHFHLVDDTVEVREVHEKNNGYDPFPVFISRNKVPKNTGTIDPNFPSSILELTSNEVHDYITPKDLQIGRVVLIFNRPFLLYDCDDFTKAFYYKNYGVSDFTAHPINDDKAFNWKPDLNGEKRQKEVENDTYSAVAKVDFSKTTDLSSTVLRYEAVLDSTKPEHQARRFIISYHPLDASISIYERQIKNSGIQGGRFLERSKVPKPGGCPEMPVYYTPGDFYVGAQLDVFRHRFVVTGADDFVLAFMQSSPHLYEQAQVKTFGNNRAV